MCLSRAEFMWFFIRESLSLPISCAQEGGPVSRKRGLQAGRSLRHQRDSQVHVGSSNVLWWAATQLSGQRGLFNSDNSELDRSGFRKRFCQKVRFERVRGPPYLPNGACQRSCSNLEGHRIRTNKDVHQGLPGSMYAPRRATI